MKILFVLENYLPHIGGVEVLFKHLMEGLSEHGHEVTLVTHKIKGTKKYEIIKGVKIHRISSFGSRYWFSFTAIPEVMRLAKDCDLIHTTTYNAALPARIAAIFRNKPSIITVHEVLGDIWKDINSNQISALVHKNVERIILKLEFNKFICVSKSTLKNLEKINKKRKLSEVIYNGVDYELFNPKRYDREQERKKIGIKNEFTCLFFGRPGKLKGVNYLIKAIPKIKNNVPNFKLILVLSKDSDTIKEYNNTLSLIKKMGVQNDIRLIESVLRKTIPQYIKAADCVVVPSINEGFGFSAAESCAMGTPVIASNNASLPEVVSGKYILINPKEPEAIAEAVFNIYNKKYQKSKLKKFFWNDTITKYLKVYDETLNKKSSTE